MTDIAAPDRFAALKHAFADLCEHDAATRTRALAALRESDAELAHDLQALFERFDASDLAPPDTALAGQRFGPFRVLRRIGSGGMGEVFLAERSDASFEQTVALKRVRRSALPGDLTARFLRERQVLARLQHPGIARLIDGGVDADGRPWLAMEYVEGLSLLQHARSRSLPLRERIVLVREVCAAVAYAHRNLVIHRDLKPANVLVTADGAPKLLDFGIAKLLDDSDADATRPDLRAHTLRYAAPEQLTGDRTTTATDIHALGLLLYELVADAPPYARASGGDIDWHRAVLGEAPRPLGDALRPRRSEFGRAAWRRIAGDLDRIVRKALAKSAGDRYASVASFDADLDDWLAERPLRSGIGGARAQTRFLLARYRWPLALAGGVLLALGIGAVLALQQARLAREQADTAHARLETLLRILGAANPHKFAGRDPSASEFLRGVATSLQHDVAGADPELARRALLEIGHGLLNLGRHVDAEPVLQAALAAADRDATLPDDTRLGILALLMHAQAAPAAAARAAASAARIETLVRGGGVSDAAAIDALARAGGTLSKYVDAAVADRLFGLAEQHLQRAVALPDGVAENYWRQRGWAALRAADAGAAVAALRRAVAIVDAAPGTFSPLRRAEGDRLLARALLLAGDTAGARLHLDRARPAFHAEYDATHPERASFDLDAAALAFATGDAAGALRAVDAIAPVLDGHGDDSAGDAVAATLLGARAAAALGRCDAAEHRLLRARSAAVGAAAPARVSPAAAQSRHEAEAAVAACRTSH